MKETHLNLHRQTIKLGLMKIVRDFFPEEDLKAAYSIQDGVFCRLANSLISKREVKLIESRLQDWVRSGRPIAFLYHKDGYYHYEIEGRVFKSVYPAGSHPKLTEPFRLVPFSTGFIVDFSVTRRGPDKELILPEKLAATYETRQRWLQNINMELVSDINYYISTGNALELINFSEALHEKEISQIADTIYNERRAVRLVLISGPSSSGKTTFTQRLSTQLRVNGLRPVWLSLDNYYVNREDTPLDKTGKYDFETINALDLKYLQKQITQLINEETVETPIFDFITGKRLQETIPLELGPSDILLLEGIHALNPKLLPNVKKNILFKIYLSALFQLNVDLANRVSTTDVRFIRRLIRGYHFRGHSLADIIEQWPNVRQSETEKIFVFTEESDAMFNSSLIYEMNAQRPFAEELLHKIKDDSPYAEIRDRFLSLLSFFQPIDSSKVPLNSILREFIGGSIY